MKYISIFKFDLYYGILTKYRKYLLYYLLILVFLCEACSYFSSIGHDTITIGDYFFFIYGGIKPYEPKPGNPFVIPYRWLLIHITILYFLLNYMSKDLSGFGHQIIYRTGSRDIWWISKCFHQIISIVLYFGGAWIEIFLVVRIINKGSMTFYISTNVLEMLAAKPDTCFIIELTILPFLFTCTVSFVQMVLCLFFKASFSFIFTIIICISSAYALHPLLLGNYSMAYRNNKMLINGIDSIKGIWILIILLFSSVVIGMLRFRKYPILCGE